MKLKQVPLILISLALLMNTSLVAAYAQPIDLFQCGQFYFHAYADPSDALARLDSGLLRIEVNGETGTGFLIDADRGYVLTAHHVVAAGDRSQHSPAKIVAAFKHSLQDTFELKYQDGNKTADVALLKITSPKKSTGKTRFEISLDFPPEGAHVALAGFAFGNKLSTDGGKIGEIHNDNKQFEIRTNTFQGDSGGPVVDQWGLVIGIVTDGRARGIALSSPTIAFRRLLMDMPRSDNAKSYAAAIMNGKVPDHFIDKFRPRHPDGFNTSNLDIIHLMTLLGPEVKKPPKTNLRKFVTCPVHRAALDRQLSIAAAELISPTVSEFADAGRSFLASGLAALRFGELATAKSHLPIAEESYLRSIRSYVSAHKAELVEKSCPNSTTDLVANTFLNELHISKSFGRSTALTSNCQPTYQDPELSRLVAAYNSARIGRAMVADAPVGVAELNDIKASSAWGALFSSSTETYLQNVANIGGAARLTGDLPSAQAAYATSWQTGNRTDEVLAKFHSSLPSGSSRSLQDSMVMINSAKGLSRSDLKILAR